MSAGVLAAVGTAAIWAAASTLLASSASRVDAISVSAVRALWAALLLLPLVPVLVLSGGFEGVTLVVIVGAVGSALVGMALGDTVYVAALHALGLARGFTISLGLFIFLTYVLGVVLLGESVTAATAIGSVLILAGVYLVALRGRKCATPGGVAAAPSPRVLARGIALVTLTALAWAVATVWLGAATDGHDPVAVGVVRLPFTAALLFGVASAMPRSSLHLRRISRWDHGALLVAGLAGTGLASLLFVFAVQEAGAGRAAVGTALSPLFAVMLGALFLGERLSRWALAGGAAAVAGIILIA